MDSFSYTTRLLVVLSQGFRGFFFLGVIPVQAQAIMQLAGNGSSVTANAAIPRAQVPASVPKHAVQDGTNGNQSQASSPCSGLSSPISVTSHAGAHSGGTSSNTDDLMAMKAVLPPRSQADPPQAITSIGAAAGTLMPAGDAYFLLETTKDLMFYSAMIV